MQEKVMQVGLTQYEALILIAGTPEQKACVDLNRFYRQLAKNGVGNPIQRITDGGKGKTVLRLPLS